MTALMINAETLAEINTQYAIK